MLERSLASLVFGHMKTVLAVCNIQVSTMASKPGYVSVFSVGSPAMVLVTPLSLQPTPT